MTAGAAAPPANLQPQNELLIQFQSALMRLPDETTEQRRKIEQVQHGRKQANRMTDSDFSRRWLTRHRSLAYATAIVLVAIAVILTTLMSRVFAPEPIGLLLLCAVIATAWLAGFGPALLAIALGTVAFLYDITPPASFSLEKQSLFVVGLSEASRLSLFIVVSLIVSSVIAAQNKTTEAVRRSRDELQAAIEGLRRTESALLKAETYLTEAQRLSQTGSFAWNVSTKQNTWSDQIYRIFEIDPATKPTFELILERTHPR
jgi:K+-sensing histidine kinase KdpD